MMINKNDEIALATTNKIDDGSTYIYTGNGLIDQISTLSNVHYYKPLDLKITSSEDLTSIKEIHYGKNSKEEIDSQLKWIALRMKDIIKTIKENHWENDYSIVESLDEINKLSVDC